MRNPIYQASRVYGLISGLHGHLKVEAYFDFAYVER